MAQLVHAEVGPTTKPIVAAGNAFAVELYGQLQSQKGNLCISPFSISSALDMTSAGAGGDTLKQMLAVLHWTAHPDALHDAVAELKLRGETIRDGTQLNVANSLFGQSGYNFRPDFLKCLADKYHAQLQQVDFRKPEQAVGEINQWAARQTHDRIKQALETSDINAITRLVLINAIYFKATWIEPFGKSATTDQPFFTSGKESMNVPLMSQRHTFSYFENDSLQLAALPYEGRYEMDILLPRSREGLPGLEKTLTTDSLNGWLNGMQPQLLALSVPKFENTGSFKLADMLIAMGMKDAFDVNKANFSGIASEPLFIGNVIHKTFISVDEAGTEAAAVTATAMRAGAVMVRKPERPVTFRADHPFLYLIRDQTSGAILFMGRVVNPTKS